MSTSPITEDNPKEEEPKRRASEPGQMSCDSEQILCNSSGARSLTLQETSSYLSIKASVLECGRLSAICKIGVEGVCGFKQITCRRSTVQWERHAL